MVYTCTHRPNHVWKLLEKSINLYVECKDELTILHKLDTLFLSHSCPVVSVTVAIDVGTTRTTNGKGLPHTHPSKGNGVDLDRERRVCWLSEKGTEDSTQTHIHGYSHVGHSFTPNTHIHQSLLSLLPLHVIIIIPCHKPQPNSITCLHLAILHVPTLSCINTFYGRSGQGSTLSIKSYVCKTILPFYASEAKTSDV